MTASPPSITRRTRLVALFALACCCLGSVIVSSTGAASDPVRSVTISPTGKVKAGDVVTVSWEGFRPGPVYLYQCSAEAVRWAQCAEVTYVKGTTADDGTGSVAFPIWRGVPLPSPPIVGTRNFNIACNAGNPCDIVVAECGFDIDSDRAAKAPIDYSLAFTGSNPSVTTTTAFATTTTTTPNIAPIDADPITTAYASSAHLLLNDLKFRALQAPHEVNIDLLTQNSPNALEQFVAGSSEVAIASLPLNEEQLAELEEQDRDVAYVPIAVSALAVAQQLHVNGIEVEEFNISADAIARIYNAPEQGDTWSQIANWNDPTLVEDNGGCDIQLDGRRYPVAVRRGDVSASNLLFTRWLDAQAPSWDLGNGYVMPINDSQVYARPSAEELAKFIAVGDLAIDHATNSAAGRIGFVDRSYAREFGLTQVAVKNGAGEYVRPTDESITAALAGDHQPGTFFEADVSSTTPGAYPMPIVYYAIVQTNVTDSFTQENADDLKTFLRYTLSAEGQERAVHWGFTPLPEAMKAEAAAATDAIGKPEEPAPTTTTTAPTGGGTDDGFGDGYDGGFDGGFEDGFGDDTTLWDDLGSGGYESDSGTYDSGSDDSGASSGGELFDEGSSGDETAAGPADAADADGQAAPEATGILAPIRSVFGGSAGFVTLPALFVLGLLALLAGHLLRRSSPSPGTAEGPA